MTQKLYPEPVVGALILNSREEILLLKSRKWSDLYVIPGGHVELGETLEEALIREVLEETGLEIHDIEFLGYQDCISDASFWKEKHFILLDFYCKSENTQVTLNDEAQEYHWVPLKESVNWNLGANTKKAIEVLIQKRR